MNRYFVFLILILSLPIFFNNCEKIKHPVPEVFVDEVFYNIEADPQLNFLSTPNMGIVVNGGYKNNGILLYRQKIEGSYDDFLAFDVTCPHEINECRMIWDQSDAWYLNCECCKSKFNIIGNYMENGPAEHPLRQYKCYFDNGDLYVSNY